MVASTGAAVVSPAKESAVVISLEEASVVISPTVESVESASLANRSSSLSSVSNLGLPVLSSAEFSVVAVSGAAVESTVVTITS